MNGDGVTFALYIVVGILSICALITDIILFISAQPEYQYFEDNCIVEAVEFKDGGVITIPDEYITYIEYNDIIFKLKDKESYKYCEKRVGKEIKCKIRRTIYI